MMTEGAGSFGAIPMIAGMIGAFALLFPGSHVKRLLVHIRTILLSSVVLLCITHLVGTGSCIDSAPEASIIERLFWTRSLSIAINVIILSLVLILSVGINLLRFRYADKYIPLLCTLLGYPAILLSLFVFSKPFEFIIAALAIIMVFLFHWYKPDTMIVIESIFYGALLAGILTQRFYYLSYRPSAIIILLLILIGMIFAFKPWQKRVKTGREGVS